MKPLRSWVIGLGLAGMAACGNERGSGRVAGPYGTPEELLAAASARVDALCDCADRNCRAQVMSAPDNPFGAASKGPRTRFSAAQKVQFSELLKRSFSCAAGQP